MKQHVIEKYFPLEGYFGKKQSFRTAHLVQRLDLIPVGTYVRKSLAENIIGRTTKVVDSMENAEDLLGCTFVKRDGVLIGPKERIWGHFSLLQVIPLLDEEIEKLEAEIANDPRYSAWKKSPEFWE